MANSRGAQQIEGQIKQAEKKLLELAKYIFFCKNSEFNVDENSINHIGHDTKNRNGYFPFRERTG